MTTPKLASISIVYRALNEEEWFRDSLNAMASQKLNGHEMEIVLVDSGSEDKTLDIANEFDCRITHIKKSDFSFGRSLNQGCDFAKGDILVFISAHCIPAHDKWLQTLVQPLLDGKADYVYGRQIGHEVTAFSENQIFAKYFPENSAIPQEGHFCNNANSAISRSAWAEFRFDEEVTGLEDMVLAKAIVNRGGKIAYVAEAPVIYIHEESYKQTQNRYYREALTLHKIMPEIQLGFGDFVRYLITGVLFDFSVAIEQKVFWKKFIPVIRFRFAQNWGNYKGHNENRKLSRAQKERYYYPKHKSHN